jgi:hypothetical protein
VTSDELESLMEDFHDDERNDFFIGGITSVLLTRSGDFQIADNFCAVSSRINGKGGLESALS